MSCDFFAQAAPGVRTLSPYVPGRPESEIKREYGLAEVIKLASNENPLGPSPLGLAAAQAALAEIARYPDGNGFELKRALAAKYGVETARITLGAGSNDILDLVARAFLTPGDEAVFSDHAFAVYPIATQTAGGRGVSVPALPAGHAMAYGHDLAAMRAAIGSRTKVVFIANPNNPTGTWLAPVELEGFLREVPEHVVVVLDEAYVEYMAPEQVAPSLAWLERHPNLVVSRTFSKAYGLAGLRVGYAFAHPQVTDLLNRARMPFNVSLPALAAATAALGDAAFIARSVELNRAGMRQLQDGLRALGLSWLPSAGNFLCVNVGRSGRQVFQALLPRGVILRPVDNYALPDFLRITVGSERENAACLRALAEVLAA